jgi:hypothetical protein
MACQPEAMLVRQRNGGAPAEFGARIVFPKLENQEIGNSKSAKVGSAFVAWGRLV